MSETLIVTIIFLAYSLVREYFYRSENRQQTPPTIQPPPEPTPVNHIMKEEENEIAFDDPDFDIRKVNKVFIDGQEREIEIK